MSGCGVHFSYPFSLLLKALKVKPGVKARRIGFAREDEEHAGR